MPTYEFRCPEGHEFEKFFRSIGTAESIAACPKCGEAAERMMSATGFAFKGSGFYLTDYGKNAHRGEAPPSGKADASEGGGGSTGDAAKADASSASDSGKTSSNATEGSGKADTGSAESKASTKAESKPAEAKPKPAPAPPKPSSSE